MKTAAGIMTETACFLYQIPLPLQPHRIAHHPGVFAGLVIFRVQGSGNLDKSSKIERLYARRSSSESLSISSCSLAFCNPLALKELALNKLF